MKFKNVAPQFRVSDIVEAIEFYQIKLGFDCIYKKNGFARMSIDDVELYLEEIDNNKDVASCRFQVSDIQSLYDAYLITGAIDQSIAIGIQPWGQRDFRLIDACGNTITFFEEIV
ncbi:hypothetical protein GV828_10275 [Flavobacterium sp. NST-5]|uniref:VOC domain-containing protein n=1 Tax=Flavobacterium ichthyis TaxID=2698827 RepID=A0ABW9ZAL3_9FLAO|nr:hypothetical protein [Flavobacterium ichthyis]NBL65587.1 hypothetical protein [Flavobacterium ichthyis]